MLFEPGHRVEVRVNQITESATGRRVSLQDVAAAADGKRFVYVGEEHDNPDAHRWQALVIGELVRRGRNVVVGFEMYQRPKQQYLDAWTLGQLSEEEFLTQSDWKGQWGFAWDLYRPIFIFAKENRLRLIALNIPRDWVRTMSRQGWDALPPEAKENLPTPYMDNKEHFELFSALVGGHAGGSVEGMYRGQVLWDEAMADSALRYFEKAYVPKNTVFVVIAGNGHLMYEQGINYRIERRTGENGITVITRSIPEGQEKAEVTRAVGDFVIGTREPKRSGQ